MAKYGAGPAQHELFFDPTTYYGVNQSTVNNWNGFTLAQLAERQPEDACLLVARVLHQNPGLIIGYIRVQTEAGTVDSIRDYPFAAKGCLSFVLEESFAGGYAVEPFSLTVGTLGTMHDNNRRLEDRRTEFTINIEPPAFA